MMDSDIVWNLDCCKWCKKPIQKLAIDKVSQLQKQKVYESLPFAEVDFGPAQKGSKKDYTTEPNTNISIKWEDFK